MRRKKRGRGIEPRVGKISREIGNKERKEKRGGRSEERDSRRRRKAEKRRDENKVIHK